MDDGIGVFFVPGCYAWYVRNVRDGVMAIGNYYCIVESLGSGGCCEVSRGNVPFVLR